MPVNPKFISKNELRKIIQENYIGFEKITKLDKQDFFGSSPPTIFVGSRLRLPEVNVGILSPPEETDNAWIYDAQTYWPTTNFTIKDIINLRSSLINSRFMTRTDSVRSNNRFTEIAQEIGIGSKPVDVEISLKKKPKFSTSFDNIRLPMGPAVSLKKARIVDNVKVDKRVDKVINDTDLKAVNGMQLLYKKGIDEHIISQLLTLGTLGLKHNRVLVPTRFCITAVDDTIGKQIISEIKDYKTINDYRLYTGNYFGNYYYILMFPDIWQYELFEGYMSGSAWNRETGIKWATDDEGYYGRKSYAQNTVGGFYASRIACCEHLKKIKRQASVLVIRFETPEYYAALGVFVVRAAARKSVANNPLIFDSREHLLAATRKLIFQRFGYGVDSIFKLSKLLNKVKSQKKLFEF